MKATETEKEVRSEWFNLNCGCGEGMKGCRCIYRELGDYGGFVVFAWYTKHVFAGWSNSMT